MKNNSTQNLSSHPSLVSSILMIEGKRFVYRLPDIKEYQVDAITATEFIVGDTKIKHNDSLVLTPDANAAILLQSRSKLQSILDDCAKILSKTGLYRNKLDNLSDKNLSTQEFDFAVKAIDPDIELSPCGGIWDVPIIQKIRILERKNHHVHYEDLSGNKNFISYNQVFCYPGEEVWQSLENLIVAYELERKLFLDILSNFKIPTVPEASSRYSLGARFIDSRGVATLIKLEPLTVIWDTSYEVEEVQGRYLDSLLRAANLADPLVGDKVVVITNTHFGRLGIIEGQNEEFYLVQGRNWKLDLRKGEFLPINPDGQTICNTEIVEKILPGYQYGQSLNLKQSEYLVDLVQKSAAKLEKLADIAAKRVHLIRCCIDLLEKGKGYAALGFKSMTDLFKSGALGYSRSNLQKQWQAAHVERLLEIPIGTLPEDHCRKLSPLVDEPEKLREVYDKALAEAEVQGIRLTAKLISSFVENIGAVVKRIASKCGWKRNRDGSRHYRVNICGVERQIQQDSHHEEMVNLESYAQSQQIKPESLIAEGLLRGLAKLLNCSEQEAIAFAVKEVLGGVA